MLQLDAELQNTPFATFKQMNRDSSDNYGSVRSNLGRDRRGRRRYLTLVATGDGYEAEVRVFSGDRLEKAKVVRTGNYLMTALSAVAARIGHEWFVFFDGHPGNGSMWFTNCLTIDARNLAFTRFWKFESGDFSAFEKSRRFIEYKTTKYSERYHKRWRELPFERVEWRWIADRCRFERTSARLVKEVPARVATRWGKLRG